MSNIVCIIACFLQFVHKLLKILYPPIIAIKVSSSGASVVYGLEILACGYSSPPLIFSQSPLKRILFFFNQQMKLALNLALVSGNDKPLLSTSADGESSK